MSPRRSAIGGRRRGIEYCVPELGLLPDQVAAMDDDRTVRRFIDSDLPRLHEILAAAFAPVFRGFRETVGAEIAAVAIATAEEEQARHLGEICASPNHHVLVATTGAEIVGFASFSVDPAERTAELGLNAVDSNRQGRGIGTLLCGEALKRMRELGAAVVEVGTGADAAHASGRRAYKKTGFGPAIASINLYVRL